MHYELTSAPLMAKERILIDSNEDSQVEDSVQKSSNQFNAIFARKERRFMGRSIIVMLQVANMWSDTHSC